MESQKKKQSRCAEPKSKVSASQRISKEAREIAGDDKYQEAYVTQSHRFSGKDLLVPYNQSVLYHSALKGKGVSTILITLEGGGHSMPTSFTRRFVIPFLDHSLYGKEKTFKDQKITLN